MLNYIKSEFYRIFHGRECYLFTGALAGLAVLCNLILFVFSGNTEGFSYACTRFSLSFLVSGLEILLLAGVPIAAFLFGEEYKSGALKNVVSYGISRNVFFFGKCIACVLTAVISMVFIVGCYIGSAYLLLEHTDPQMLLTALRGILVNLPMAAAAVILAIALLSSCKNETLAAICWFCVMWAGPVALSYLGLKIPLLARIADWCPWVYLKNGVYVTMSESSVLWETPSGIAKCLIAGLAGMLIFSLAGMAAFRKKEVV